MIIIRPEKQEEYNQVFHIHKRAFGQEDEARLVEKIRQSPGYVPELSLVAVKDGKAVGHILFSAVTLNLDSGGSMPVLSLAPSPGRGVYAIWTCPRDIEWRHRHH